VFKIKHPTAICSLSSFEDLKPWWVKRLKLWNTCCCKYHQELTELMIALDAMRTHKHGIHKDCQCDCDMICGGLGCEQYQGMCNSHREVYN
jgi:hypothetical protein